MALAVYAAFVEREKFPIHPDDFTYSIREWALSDNRSDELALQLKLQQSVKAMEKGDEEVGETTHLCVADEQGNVAALTQSIQSLFGALVVNRPLGFLYNNYLSTCPRYRHPYQLASKCLPRSNAAPTFLLKDGQVVLALGAAGSRRIISSILQIISQIVDHGKSVAEAITAPRVHAPLNGKVWIEKPAATAANIQNLKSHFNKVVIRSKHSFAMAGAQALAIGQDADQIKTAAADPRRDGMAGGF